MGLAESLRSDFGIDVRPRWPFTMISVRGDLDLATSPALDATLKERGTGNVAIDLSAVTFIDCGSVRSLLVAKKRTEARGSAFTVINPSSIVRRLLSLLDPQGSHFGIAPAVRDAEQFAPPRSLGSVPHE